MTRTLHRRTIRLSAGSEPPREFRIFAEGENDSTKGAVQFDAKSARAVMREYEKQGVDVMIDLEHLSLDQESRSYDPDARGWCKLEVRGGELWAVDVRWTPEGERRLREKRQRYISPAFYTDKHGRVTELVNVAICAMPATHDAPALVAASKRAARSRKARRHSMLNPETIKKAIAALKEGDGDAALALLEALIADAAGGEGEGAPEAAPDAMAEDEESEEMMADDDKPDAMADDDEDAEEAKRSRGADKESARVIAEMAAKLERLEKRTQRQDVRELVRLNADRIPPTLEKWALAQTPDVLREFLKHAPKQAVQQPPRQDSAGAGSASAELTEEDIKLCRMLGTDASKVLAHKRARAQGVK